jgi:hypothetical protein
VLALAWKSALDSINLLAQTLLRQWPLSQIDDSLNVNHGFLAIKSFYPMTSEHDWKCLRILLFSLPISPCSHFNKVKELVSAKTIVKMMRDAFHEKSRRPNSLNLSLIDGVLVGRS